MIIYFFFALVTWLFIWYSKKLINDVSGRDQYWHTPQMIFLIVVFLMPGAALLELSKYAAGIYLIRVSLWGLMFPFLFNVGLNLYRQLPVNYLGKYDFLTFTQTVLLFVAGLISSTVFNYFQWR